ncbi:hypothetical protein [Streptomyces sp. F001]|uniref:hypothetical protein n=1 Tax=Streptomyces sp. F001 TaxID=1510026 RepID=UPI0019D0F957
MCPLWPLLQQGAGVERAHLVLATRAGDRSRLVTVFRTAARAHLSGPTDAGGLPSHR